MVKTLSIETQLRSGNKVTKQNPTILPKINKALDNQMKCGDNNYEMQNFNALPTNYCIQIHYEKFQEPQPTL